MWSLLLHLVETQSDFFARDTWIVSSQSATDPRPNTCNGNYEVSLANNRTVLQIHYKMPTYEGVIKKYAEF